MNINELVKTLRSEIRFAGENGFCVIDPAIIKSTISIIESQREALRDTCQRLNESGPGEMSLVNTIHDAHRIARQEIEKEV